MATSGSTALVLALLLATGATRASSSPEDNLSAYQVLESYDFPIGLLPEGVSGYELDRETGRFKAYWNDSCSFSIKGSYQLKYKSTISGYISKDRLRNLSGVSVKVWIFWLNIVEVVRYNDELDFSVGIASASFAINNFVESPRCGCGFDCVSKGSVGRRGRPFVSSS